MASAKYPTSDSRLATAIWFLLSLLTGTLAIYVALEDASLAYLFWSLALIAILIFFFGLQSSKKFRIQEKTFQIIKKWLGLSVLLLSLIGVASHLWRW